MSTPQEATEFTPKEDWEVTPVIIKTGGGTGGQTGGEVDPPAQQVLCTIDVQHDTLENQGFISTLLGNQWQSAKSDKVASIKEVLIIEKGKDPITLTADLPGLATLQISYGQETLIVQEVARPDSKYTNLSISSSVPFGVPAETTTAWTNSTADVPAEPPFVVFSQGDNVNTTKCGSMDVEIQINVDWGKEMK